ncbi:hypothetical protein NFI96_007389 [Prochilodus magdalenae]|nr:hypothetical protein NFI96_007389 [Prochilodus magdalenae]
MRRTFFNPEGGRAAAPRLLPTGSELPDGGQVGGRLCRRTFGPWGLRAGWNNGKEALMALFHQGLNERLKDELATRDLPPTLEGLYDVAIAMDNRLRERGRSRTTRFQGSPSWPASPRFINEVLREALDRYAYVYLDDILIFSRTREEHVGHVRRILQLLLESRLYVKLEKSEFHVPKVSFLGFIVSKGTLAMDPAKIRAVQDWPPPSSLKEVQRFLGFANFFRRFVRNFSAVAAPLTALTRKTPGRFRWTVEAQQAFEELTRCLTTAPVLQLPDPRAPFIVEVDASDVGVGAVLSQRSGIPNKAPSLCVLFAQVDTSGA